VSGEPLLLLTHLYGDPEMSAVFSEKATVQAWLEVEVALARAQVAADVLASEHADTIAEAAGVSKLDLDQLWAGARNVGYPILDLVRAVNAEIDRAGHQPGHLHYGATTQDIMDSGLAIQIDRALRLLRVRISAFGDGLAEQVRRHARTVMPARTHAQQAVPTTLGAILATLLDELGRHRARLGEVRTRACRVSSFGAGGTSAAQGLTARQVRATMAELLGLADADVPWHTARDGIAEFGWLCATVAATCARFARMVVDLSRTEIGELHEPSGYHRGASSTMPQKVNPVASEAVIGMAITAGALTSALTRAQEVGHERAAGEAHAEWQVLPQLAVLAASALSLCEGIATGLDVDPAAMRANLERDGGLIMAEAYMIALAPALGRENAHDLVYAAARRVRAQNGTLSATVRAMAAERGVDLAAPAISPSDYLGEVESICDSALRAWEKDTN
jgi:3-carboxy-cis,cis-muconate cycloisomerase